MATSRTPQVTDFSRDILGRYVCNGLDEALRSADPSVRPDVRPFDVVVIGGGAFGLVFAQHLMFQDKAHRHRILVLEAGPVAVPEHVQNLPRLGLHPPGPSRIADLRAIGAADQARSEVWGLAWHSPIGFPGLAYCVGGRSIFFGGWSPRLLAEEMPEDRWPAEVRADLNDRYFDEAAEQIGTDVTNDFIGGPLHRALRRQLLEGVNGGHIRGAIPLGDLPSHLKQKAPRADSDELKLEAPLAVQSKTRSGFFPFNKFSSVQLAMKATRLAWEEARAGNGTRADPLESGADDFKKRLMLVPHCHVKRLVTEGGRVTRIETNRGDVSLPEGGKAIVAIGTIESARLALLSFGGLAGSDQIGKNLIAHLRSNVTIRIPRAAIDSLPKKVRELQASALFLKGRHEDGGLGHFHIQITAAGLDRPSGDSEAELFKKVPDIDTYDDLRQVSDTQVVLTLRGIGEMEPDNAASFVRLDPEPDELGVQRAYVEIEPSDRDRALWETMDQATDDLARVFAGNHPYEVKTAAGFVPLAPGQELSEVLPFEARHDGLGTTHHEAGTLRMGTDPVESPVDPDGKFHGLSNVYACGPATFPTVGSPNPMLTGVALARRLAEHLEPGPPPYRPEAGFTALFDGLSLHNWRMAGRGGFRLVDGTLESVPGDNLGLLWCTIPTDPDFVLRLQWLRWRHEANSGIFLRFPSPESKGYENEAYVGVHFGFEVQIDEVGAPDGADIHKTGALYGQQGQDLSLRPARSPGEWNDFEIRVEEQIYTVLLNGEQVTRFTFEVGSDPEHPGRGLPSTPEVPRFIGLQSHPSADLGSRVAFRNIRIRAL